MIPVDGPSEFHRAERVDAIGDQPRVIAVTADAAERAALAERFGLIEIARLTATFTVRRTAEGVRAHGRVDGAVVQACTVTGDPIAVDIDEPVDLRFVDADTPLPEEVELSADDCDVVDYRGGTIDLGEAAAESLALALDPFPRGPRAEAVLREAGVLGEGEAGPFGALAALKDKLARGA